MNYHGQRRINIENAGAIPLPQEINHVFGAAATVITRATPARFLVLSAEVDGWRLKPGTFPSLSASAPSGAVTDGTGSLLLKQGDQLVIPAPDVISVRGPSAGSILTYFWV